MGGAPLEGMQLRPGEPGDAEGLAANVEEGFAGYARFAPPGWRPPRQDRAQIRDRLADPSTWCLVAMAGPSIAGHASFLPAVSAAGETVADPQLAHLWHLFVRPSYQGSGLATLLHQRALAEARERGFRHMRLFTPAGHARARRFYEREGWSATGLTMVGRELGLPIAEYRRPV
jgi:GNAT superfamily N-acetyltransferase